MMGAAQAAQRGGSRDAAAGEESGAVHDAQSQDNTGDKPLKNNGQISEINGKADASVTEVNGHCEDEIAAEAILSPEGDVSETEKPIKGEKPLGSVESDEKESSNEADANEDIPLEMIEMDAKQNDINESFRRFFSNIGLKLTVKRGSSEIASGVSDETNKEELDKPADTARKTKSENAELNINVNTAHETDATCPILTVVTSEALLKNAEEKATEAKEESGNADGEDAHQDANPKEEPHSTSPPNPEEEVVMSPFKRFFTTGIFSGLRKKKKPAEEQTTEKELADVAEKKDTETTDQTVEDQQQDKEEVSLGVEAAAVEAEHKEYEVKEEIMSAASAQTTDDGKSSSTDPSTIIVTEPDSSQEKDKVQASPLRRLLSGSSLKKLSKKQRSRRSSDAKLSDSGEHALDQFVSSTELPENQKEEDPAQPSAESAGEEEGAWASFKKLVTPKKRMKRSSLSNEETQISGSTEEPKPGEGEQILDHSTEEGKKRKDSSVSWEAVLCGSGRRRSRKTSDSEDETPQIDNKQDGESFNENEILASSPKQSGSPSDSDGGSTWKSLKRLVTPKRKAKEEDESKDNTQSDSELTQDESSFSIKKLLPGRKKRRSAEKQDQISSDEADRDVASGDEDFETPAVIPLSEFDTVETEVHIQTQADIESHIPEDADYELQKDLLDQMAEPVIPCDSLQTEAKKVQDDDAREKQVSMSPATDEEPDDLTESTSKHQQLSDIPEEGVITDTMATPASVNEEVARDDTIAEDLIEITSEAITAPEPASDITPADETEMISAVSQLSSESSKTSGNTTPVPAEYDMMETDTLLHQAVETISTSPKAVPVCSDELSSEKIVGSVTLEAFVKEGLTILDEHRRLDAAATDTGLNIEMDVINDRAATSQTESISEVSVSTEIVSEVPTEEFDTAEIAVDEIQVDVTHPEENGTELETIDESHHLDESLSETDAVVSTDKLPEDEEFLPAVVSLVEASQTETEPPKMEADSAVTDETEDGAMEQEIQTVTEKDKDQPPVEVEELQKLKELVSEEGSAQSLEMEVISEDIAAAETDSYELKEETAPLTEVNVEPEMENELETDASKTEHVQVPESPKSLQVTTLDSEENSVQPPEEEVKSEDIPPAETVIDEPKQTAEHLTEVSVEPEDKDLPLNAVTTEYVQEPDALEAVQVSTLNSDEGSVQSLQKEAMSEDIPEAETVIDESKEETVLLTEVSLEPVDASKPEHVQEPEVLQDVHALEKEVTCEDVPAMETVTDEPKQETELKVELEEKLPVEAAETEHVEEPEVLEDEQAATFDSEEGSVQLFEKEAISEDVPQAETVTDEPKEESKTLTEVSLEQVDASKPEHVQEPEVLEDVQAAVLDSAADSLLPLDKEVTSEDIPAVETVTDEPKQTAEHLTDVSVEPENKELPENVVTTEHVQEPEVLEDVHALEKEVTCDDIPAMETVTDEPKQETEMRFEPEEKLPVEAAETEHVEEPEVLEDVQTAALDSEEGSIQLCEKEAISEDVPQAESVTAEPKEETKVLAEVNLEQVDASKPEHVQEPEILEDVQAAVLDSAADSLLPLDKEVTSEDIPVVETVTDQPKEEAELRAEPEEKLPVEGAKTEHVQESEVLEDVHALKKEVTCEEEPEILEDVQAAVLNSAADSLFPLDKEVTSEDIPAMETVTDEPKQETEMRVEPEEKLPVEAVDNEHVQEPKVLEDVQAAALDSEEGSVQLLEKESMSEDVTPAETVTDEPKEETKVLAEVDLEQVDASKPEHVQEPEVLEDVQAAVLDSEAGELLSLEKEVESEDIPAVETVVDQPKQETELRAEPEEKLPVEGAETDHVQEPAVLEDVQAAVSDSEASELLPLEKEVTSEDIPAVETTTDEPKQETELRVEPEDKRPMEAAEIEHVEKPDVQTATLDSAAGSVQLLEKEAISDDIPEAETVIDELKEETIILTEEEKLHVEGAKIDIVQEPEVSPSDVKHNVNETKTEEEALICAHVVTGSIEGGSAQELEKQILSEDVPKPDTNTAIASVTNEIEGEVVAQLGQALEITQDQKTESITQDVQVEDCIPEVVDELQTLRAVHVPSVNEEASNVQVLEKTVLSEETSAPCADNAAVTDEPKHEVHLSVVQGTAEGEKESDLPGTEIKTAAAEHAVVAQVIICNLKDVSDATPDALKEEKSEITEPLIDTLTSELAFKDEVEAATPLVRDDAAETAEEGSEVVMMHVPSVMCEDNHRVQEQVVDANIKSAETIVDSVLEVGVTEAKEVIELCHETLEKVDDLSATPETEEELINEETKVTIQEVIQHEEKVPETAPESAVVNLEQEDIKQSDAVIKVSEMVESESNDVEDQKAMEDSTGTFSERPDEAPAAISDDPATEQQVCQDLMQTPDIPGSLDASIHKEEFEEAKAESEKSEVGVTAESSQELDVEKIHEQAQTTQVAQSPTATPTDAGLAVPQNTGISVQAVEAEEPGKPIDPTLRAESDKQTELTEVAFQVTEITDPAANLDSTKRPVIMTQPELLHVDIQATESVEPVEEIESTERVTSSVQATETIEPISPTEEREVFQSQPLFSEACDRDTKAEEPVKQTEGENDQDVWMDAEEIINSQEETEESFLEVEEPREQTASEQEEKAGPGHEVETAPKSKTEEEESQQEMHKTEETCEIESEGEDFAVALEHLETSPATVTTNEWD